MDIYGLEICEAYNAGISKAGSQLCKLDKPICTDLRSYKTMESYVWIRTADGSVREVEREVAMLWPAIDCEMKSGLGSSKNNPISLHQRIRPNSLSLVIDYCRFHRVRRCYQEPMPFDERFLHMDAKGLIELLVGAMCLQLGPLVKSTKEALAQKISNKSAEEIWHMLNLTDGLPEAAKLQLQQYSKHDTRARLLEKYYSNKKKSFVKEIGYLKDFVTGVKPTQQEDTREVDDLVSFINGGDEDTKGIKTSKRKTNHKKRKEQKKTSSNSASSSIEASASKKIIEKRDEDISGSDSANHSGSTADTLKLLGSRDESFNFGDFNFDDDDYDDILDPVLKEEDDRMVEAFARLMNVDMADLLIKSPKQTCSSYR